MKILRLFLKNSASAPKLDILTKTNCGLSIEGLRLIPNLNNRKVILETHSSCIFPGRPTIFLPCGMIRIKGFSCSLFLGREIYERPWRSHHTLPFMEFSSDFSFSWVSSSFTFKLNVNSANICYCCFYCYLMFFYANVLIMFY